MANLSESTSWAADRAVTTIDLIRHGEPEGGPKYRGHRDDPLSELGWQQMREATDGHSPWSKIYSSPLLRCREFAYELASNTRLAVEVKEEFKEVNFGCWEGQTSAEICAADPTAIERFWADPIANAPDGCEGFDNFVVRIQAAWRNLLAEAENEHVLLVCHGGVIRALVHTVLETPLRNLFHVHVPYAGVTRLRVFGSGADAKSSLVFHAGTLDK